MKNYSLETLKKMLERAESKYAEETVRPCGSWGDGMRLSKLPSIAKWERAKARVEELKSAIAEKEKTA